MTRCCSCYPHYCFRKRYGFGSFLWDIFMFFMTWGLWGIWILVREIKNSRCRCCGC